MDRCSCERCARTIRNGHPMIDHSEPRARQQAAIVSLTRFALRSVQITATIEFAVRTCVEVLSAPIGVLLQLAEPGLAVLAHSRGPVSMAPGEVVEADAERLTATVSRDSPPYDEGIRLHRAGGTTRVDPRVRACLSVLVTVEEAPWGRLVVADDEPRDFDPDEVRF